MYSSSFPESFFSQSARRTSSSPSTKPKSLDARARLKADNVSAGRHWSVLPGLSSKMNFTFPKCKIPASILHMHWRVELSMPTLSIDNTLTSKSATSSIPLTVARHFD